MSPEREPMENDSNSCTAEELEQQTVDVYVERALHARCSACLTSTPTLIAKFFT